MRASPTGVVSPTPLKAGFLTPTYATTRYATTASCPPVPRASARRRGVFRPYYSLEFGHDC